MVLTDDARTYLLKMSTKKLLRALGLDVKSQHFMGTPDRVAKAYREICWGCFVNFDEEVRKIMSSQFDFEGDQIVGARPTVWGLCPHHLLPAKIRVYISYLPNGKILGLSKLHRLANLVASIPSCQENMASIIANIMMDYLKPKGVMVKAFGHHLCAVMRGVKDENMTFYDSAVRGDFKENPVLRNEAMKLAQLSEEIKND